MSNLRIEVTRGGDLARQEWCFWYYEGRHALVLDSYWESERSSKRHKFRTAPGRYYCRLHRSDEPPPIAEAGVPMPEDVLEEARQKFNESLRVVRWSERGG
ncbi:MAG TPA: hypothetical protein VK421_05965 [Pyrinomonadaceae bacterium]|nr:hypothetical protein [Pyrinomonadaceae bacterium]